MTERYNRKEVTGQHLVLMRKPAEIPNLHCYDFEKRYWRPVRILDNLPYGLATYVFTDEEEDETRCVVTCHDSYRLSTDKYWLADDLTAVPNEEFKELEDERRWRDELCEKGARFDYNNHKNTVCEAEVKRIKSDIIPGVLHIADVDSRGKHLGYIYKESEKLYKHGTLVQPTPQEELDRRARAHEEFLRKRRERRVKSLELQKKLDLITWSRYKAADPVGRDSFGSPKVFDTRPIFAAIPNTSLVCLADLDAWVDNPMNKQQAERTQDGRDKTKAAFRTQSPIQLCYSALVTTHKDAGVAWIATQAKKSEHSQDEPNLFNLIMKGSDAVCNVKVHGATHACLLAGWGRPGHAYSEDMGLVIPLVKDSDGIFVLEGLSQKSPLHRSMSGSPLEIYTDGDKVTCVTGVYHHDTAARVGDMGNSCSISEAAGRILFNGHAWQPTFSCPKEELFICDPAEKQLLDVDK